MKRTFVLTAVGHATSLLLAVTFALCVGVTVVFPSHNMAPSLQQLLPGFQWISWKSFVLGLIESYGYGWYIALIWVPIYNVVAARSA